MYSRAHGIRVVLRFAILALVACGLDPRTPIITRLTAYGCGNAQCTILGAKLIGLPPQTGLFMVGAWFKGTQDVHWTIRWPSDSVQADFTNLRDSSIVAAQLDSMPLTVAIVLTVRLVRGGHASLSWDFR